MLEWKFYVGQNFVKRQVAYTYNIMFLNDKNVIIGFYK